LGPRLRIVCVFDGFPREALALLEDTSMGGRRLVRELNALIACRCKPALIVGDNAAKMTSRPVPKWSNGPGVALHRAGQAATERLREILHW
jgi:putative transposase